MTVTLLDDYIAQLVNFYDIDEERFIHTRKAYESSVEKMNGINAVLENHCCLKNGETDHFKTLLNLTLMEQIFEYAIEDTSIPAGIDEINKWIGLLDDKFTENPWLCDDFWIKQLINVSRNDSENIDSVYAIFDFLEGGYTKKYVEKEKK